MNNHTITPNPALASRLTKIGWALSILVLLLVGAMRSDYKIPLPDGVTMSFMPAVNATLNSLVALFLIFAVVAVKKKNILLHKKLINAAMITSVLFLLCYVAYHFTTVETRYGGEGSARTAYFILLISHIVLAGISLPFIVQTWVLGFCGMVEKHRKWTRFVFPVWLYVAITGPICYFMLRPYY